MASRNTRWLGIGVLALAQLVSAAAVEAKVYRLYYLGGQSNMVGGGQVDELPEETRQPVAGVMIYEGATGPDGVAPVNGRGRWEVLDPGGGGSFGPEIGFGREILKRHPNENIALLKVARGGSALDVEAAFQFGSWAHDYNEGEGPGQGINIYDHFLAAVRHATAVRDIDGDGVDDTLVPAGIVWVHGGTESGIGSEAAARRYGANLTQFMNLARAALRVDDLPVVVSVVGDSRMPEVVARLFAEDYGYEPGPDGGVWKNGPIIVAGQRAFVEEDGNAALVASEGLSYRSDAIHYDTAGLVEIGRRLAVAMAELEGR